ncbi:MAG TPA: GNAT family N-acetyltransferase [Solirubrobacteraceae bacterium]|nr:GNAT family N-acetyltransferase [Solirubrobacteraceae bacterium]
MKRAPEAVLTERLALDRVTPDDEPGLSRIFRDPLVAATLSETGAPPSAAQLHERHAAKLAHWERFGFGVWVVRDRVSRDILGQGGLQHAFAKGLDDIEVGWTIAPERWGEGLATEVALASVETAFGALALPRVIALTTAENTASQRVMEKAGFRFERKVRERTLVLRLYVLDRC